MVARSVPCITNLRYGSLSDDCARQLIDISKAKYGHRKSLKALLDIYYDSCHWRPKWPYFEQ